MLVPQGVDQREGASEYLRQARRVVTHHRKAAAPVRAVRREGGDDGVPSDSQAPYQTRDVSSTVMLVGQEVERCPVMPDVVCLRRLPGRNVGDNPMNQGGSIPKTGLGRIQRGLRQIEHGDITESTLDEVINQS